jgi:hypothetical protein
MKQLIFAADVGVGPGPLPGMLAAPQKARGLIIFAHGSGSSRLSPSAWFDDHIQGEGDDHAGVS